jgi:hypothetical protein
MASLTATPHSNDGYAFYGSGAWSSCRAGVSSGDQIAWGNDVFIAVAEIVTGTYWQYRSNLIFDTSSIPAGSTITGVSLTITSRAARTDAGFCIVASPRSGTNVLATGDSRASLWGTTSAGTYSGSAAGDGSTHTVTIDNAIVPVNIGGYTQYGARNYTKDLQNSTPSGSFGPFGYSALAGTSSYRPQLTVEYTGALICSPFPPSFRS